MSGWFGRNSPIRSSFRNKFNSLAGATVGHTDNGQPDAQACFDTFRSHWTQSWNVMQKHMMHPDSPSRGVQNGLMEDIRLIFANIDYMVALLLQELKAPPNGIGTMLEYLLSEDILEKIFSWSINRNGEHTDMLKMEQLRIYECLLSGGSRQDLLVHKGLLHPLLRLLAYCGDTGAHVDIERRLVLLLNRLCFALTSNPNLLDFFFDAGAQQGPSKFVIFSLLVPFIHREGSLGQQSRDALILCVTMSANNKDLTQYIVEHSNFCPVLATGLSGLYSVLPRRLQISADDWHRLTAEDVGEIPDLIMFLSSLEFCNAVIRVSNSEVQQQVLEYVYQGFLMPVFGPALQQDAVGVSLEFLDLPSPASPVEEVIAATAYLELCLRTVTEPLLMKMFLQFLLTQQYEGVTVTDTLIRRINSPSRLCLVTLSLFRTLLELHCEDLMLELVFKYLMPCKHVMVSQRSRVKEHEIYGKSAEKFLCLIPDCCEPFKARDASMTDSSAAESQSASFLHRSFSRVRSPSMASFTGSEYENANTSAMVASSNWCQNMQYYAYLRDAGVSVRRCKRACTGWIYAYDGDDATGEPTPRKKSNVSICSTESPFIESVAVKSLSTSIESNGCESFLCEIDPLKRIQNGGGGDAILFNGLPIDHEEDADRCQSNSGARAKVRVVSKSDGASLSCSNSSDTAAIGFSLSVNGCDRTADAVLPNIEFERADTGPFLSTLLDKLNAMCSNTLYVNLQLTGVLAILAAYPQPLLRSFLLNHTLVFQPSVRSLLQVLGSLKHKIDNQLANVPHVADMVQRARRFLLVRADRLSACEIAMLSLSSCGSDGSPSRSLVLTSVADSGVVAGGSPPNSLGSMSKSRSMSAIGKDNRRRSLADMIFRRAGAAFSNTPGPMMTGPSPFLHSIRQREPLEDTKHWPELEHHQQPTSLPISASMSAVSEQTQPPAILETLTNNAGYRYLVGAIGGEGGGGERGEVEAEGYVESLHIKNAVMSAVVLEEFLKELSAVTLEHAVQGEGEDVDWSAAL